MISSGQPCRITPEYVHIYRHLLISFHRVPCPFFRSYALNGFHPERFLFPDSFQKTDNLITAHSCGRTHCPAVWYLLLFMSVMPVHPGPVPVPFLRAVFSARSANHAQSGRYPSGQAIQFSRCKCEHWHGHYCFLHLLGSARPECFLH